MSLLIHSFYLILSPAACEVKCQIIFLPCNATNASIHDQFFIQRQLMTTIVENSSYHSLRIEIIAGMTTFLTMVYIAFVNPHILHDAGMEPSAVFTATCLVTAFGCALTGLMANVPIAVAPGMALSIYFSYSIVQELGISWQRALAMVFISGIMFLGVSLTPLRRLLIESIPPQLQIAILIGISLLIALISLESNGLIVSDHHRLMHLGHLNTPQTGLFLLGFLIILVLDYYQIAGAIIISILSITILSLVLGLSEWKGIVATPPSLHATFLKMDFTGLTTPVGLKATFTFFLIAIFDATGTLIGLFKQSLFDQTNDKKRLANSLTADASASVLASMLGSASTSPYIESATGISAGGSQGITALVVALGFLAMLFFYPLAQAIPHFAVGPALLYVACCMMKNLTELKLTDITESAPCMLTILMIPFTASIADGIGMGIVFYTLLKFLARERLNPFIVILTGIFIVFFVIS